MFGPTGREARTSIHFYRQQYVPAGRAGQILSVRRLLWQPGYIAIRLSSDPAINDIAILLAGREKPENPISSSFRIAVEEYGLVTHEQTRERPIGAIMDLSQTPQNPFCSARRPPLQRLLHARAIATTGNGVHYHRSQFDGYWWFGGSVHSRRKKKLVVSHRPCIF